METVHDRFEHVQLHRRIIQELGYTLCRRSTILDFGCGAGETVSELRKLDFDAYGVDITLDHEDPFLRLIPTTEGYRIPFDDQTFDFVYSDQVFEHVQNYDAALSEIWRVLKPGGISLHLFPPRYLPLEPHTFVPLAGVFRSRGWLFLWALLGVRNGFQRGLNHADVVERNYNYLRRNTCYLTKRSIRRLVLARFANVTFAEQYFIKHSYGRARRIYPLVRVFPWLSALFSSFHQRVVFFKKDTV